MVIEDFLLVLMANLPSDVTVLHYIALRATSQGFRVSF